MSLNVNGFIIGIILSMLCIALMLLLPGILAGHASQNAIEIFEVLLVMAAVVIPVIGALDK